MKFNNLLSIVAILLVSNFAFSSSTPSSSVRPGTIFMWGGATCPTSSIPADGSSLLRAGIYANLFANISTAWGTADGTHFNAPIMLGLFPRGVSGSSSNDPDKTSQTAIATGGNSGNNVGSFQADQFQGHSHTETASFSSGSGNLVQLTTNGASPGSTINVTGTIVTDTVNGTPRFGTETRPANVYVTYCVQY